MSDPGGTAGPSWQPDPYGRHQYRYWDGGRWTERVASNGQESFDPIDVAPTAPAAPIGAQGGKAKGPWLLGGGGVVVVAVVVVVLVVFVFGGNDGGGGTGTSTFDLKKGEVKVHTVHVDAGGALAVSWKVTGGDAEAVVAIDAGTAKRFRKLGYLTNTALRTITDGTKHFLADAPKYRAQAKDVSPRDPTLDLDGFKGVLVGDLSLAPASGTYAVVFVGSSKSSAKVRLTIATKADPKVHHDLTTKQYRKLDQSFYRDYIKRFCKEHKHEKGVCSGG